MRPHSTCRILSKEDHCLAFSGSTLDDHRYLNTRALSDQAEGQAVTLVWGPTGGTVLAYATISLIVADDIVVLVLERMHAHDPASACAGSFDFFVDHVMTHIRGAAIDSGIDFLVADQAHNAFVDQLRRDHGFSPVRGTGYLLRAVG